MKYLSLFSGIGGFELGIQQAYESLHNESKNERLQVSRNLPNTNSNNVERATCIGFSEIDKYAIATYQKHYPTHHNYGDITRINADELPDFDLLVGGFPCQAFSIAGKRKGFEDTRGTLFFEIARILRAKQPRLFCLENVKGLLSHDNGATFSTIISTLDELGYDLQWQVLNSKNHGVPQNRERIFIIGHLRGTSRPKVFPFGETPNRVSKQNGGLRGEVCYNEEGGNKSDNNGKILQDVINRPLHLRQIIGGSQGERVYDPEGVSTTLAGLAGGHGAKTGLYLTDMKIRRLTPTECERLQGFPDGWTIGSDTQRYKQCGNAVTVNVIKDIMERLL